jgi:ABC-type transporter Mla MlaB component
MARKPTPTARSLSLEGDLDVFSVHHQWEQVQALLAAENGTVEIDLAAVGDLDLSGVQLLSALDRDLRVKGIQLSMTGAKEEWMVRFAPLGLADLFGGTHP